VTLGPRQHRDDTRFEELRHQTGKELSVGIDRLSADLLNAYVGVNIVDICAFGFTHKTNHCAHFVSHVLQLELGYTCGRGGVGGRSVRVHEIFAKCPRVGKFDDRPTEKCLIFVISPREVNLKKKVMSNVPKKHIGIYVNGTIWHYSNSREKVVTQKPAEFKKHYPGQTNGLFYGTFPTSATAIPFLPRALHETGTRATA
jgi:hypothetical protein